MSEILKTQCPECGESDEAQALDRRSFIRVMGGTTATAVAAGAVAPQLLAQAGLARVAQQPAARHAKPAEALIQELYNTMTADQRRTLVLPWNDRNRTAINPNRAINNQRLGDHYTRAQQDLIERILRAVSSGEEGFAKLQRREPNGRTFDNSGSLQGCGSHIFGTPGPNQQYAWVFSGHHLTVRCDGNSQPDAAFGGPMYYGHSPDGHSRRNIFYYQTQAVNTVFDSLTEAQRRQSVLIYSRETDPGEGAESVRFRQQHPGIPSADLTADQRRLVETVMREVLSPYRREDADEVMELIRRNGGLERIHLAFYRDEGATDTHRWHFWRLEGPGFVWNYRVMPHVHCFVNIGAAPRA
jgi:hypothetical protein